MKGLLIGLRAKKALKKQQGAEFWSVHSVFKHAVNLELNEDIITLVTRNISPHPFTITLPVEDMVDLGLSRGDIVQAGESCMTLKNGMEIQLEQTPVWDSRPHYTDDFFTKNELIKRIEALKEISVLEHKGGLSEIFKNPNITNPFIKASHFQISRLISSQIARDYKEIVSSGKALIGMGQGLTPSGDDFLAGYMVTFLYAAPLSGIPRETITELNGKLIEGSNAKTTFISWRLMNYAARGEISLDVRELIQSLLYRSKGGNLHRKAGRVIEFGETSGSDTIVGIMCCMMGLLGINEILNHFNS